MNGGLGGVGKQVGSDLFELGKSVVKNAGKVAGDTISDSIEQIMSAPVGVGSVLSKNEKKAGEERGANQKEVEKKQKEKRQFQEVRGQLSEYIQRKKQQDEQIAREKAEKEQEDKQKKAYDKQKKDSFVKQLMKRIAGQSHGESDRQKE